MRDPHHGNILSGLLELIFDAPGDVPQVRQRELLKLDRPQDAGVRLEHLQGLQGEREKFEVKQRSSSSSSNTDSGPP